MMMKKINILYRNLFQYQKRQKKTEIDYDSKSYSHLVNEFYELLKQNPEYNQDVVYETIDSFLHIDISSGSITEERGEELMKKIEDRFSSKAVFYLFIPFNGTFLKSDISFGNFNFICGTEDEKIEKINAITNIDKSKLEDDLDHTKKSRSHDFLKLPLLILKVEKTHENIHRHASLIAQSIFSVIKLIMCSNEIELQGLNRFGEYYYEENYHVAYFSEQRLEGHSHWYNLIKCKVELDTFKDIEMQNRLMNYVNHFIFTKIDDELHFKFCNALVLFEKSLDQYENYRDRTLSTLLLFSAAESLLTEGANEKRLRLSVIWPRIIEVNNINKKDLSLLIRDNYMLRNNFVHAGHQIHRNENEELTVLHTALAKLIVFYIEQSSWNVKEVEDEKNLTSWNRFVNGIFEEAIYGGDD